MIIVTYIDYTCTRASDTIVIVSYIDYTCTKAIVTQCFYLSIQHLLSALYTNKYALMCYLINIYTQ